MNDLIDYNLESLSRLLCDNGRETVENFLSGFVPAHGDSSPARFLYDKAITMELKDLSRTHLALSDNLRILGFFTLSIKCMRVPEDNLLSKTSLRDMNIESTTGVAQSYLLGQLCRSEESWVGFGRTLMNEARLKIQACKSNVGCRMIRLDCSDDMVQYYESTGFRRINKNMNGKLNQMYSIVN